MATSTNKIQYKVDVDAGAAEAGFVRVADVQKIIESSAQRTTRAIQSQHSAMDKYANVAAGWGKQLLALTGVSFGLSGLKSIADDILETQKAVGEKKLQFEKDITDYLSLGDNIDKIPEVKSQIQGYAVTLRKSAEEIARAKFNLQSATSNLDESVRAELWREGAEIVQSTSADMSTAVNLMAKGYQIYGDSIKDADQLQRKFFVTAQEGHMTMQQMAENWPEVAAVAHALGYGIDELNTGLIAATVYGGDVQKAFTSTRNVLIALKDSVDKGFVSTGSFLGDIQKLSSEGATGLDLLDMAGKRAVNTMAALVQHSGELSGWMKKLQNPPDISKNLYQKRLATDTTFQGAVFGERMKGALDEAEITARQSPELKQYAERRKVFELGFKHAAPTSAWWLEKPMYWWSQGAAALGIESPRNKIMAHGAAQLKKQLKEGGASEEEINAVDMRLGLKKKAVSYERVPNTIRVGGEIGPGIEIPADKTIVSGQARTTIADSEAYLKAQYEANQGTEEFKSFMESRPRSMSGKELREAQRSATGRMVINGEEREVRREIPPPVDVTGVEQRLDGMNGLLSAIEANTRQPAGASVGYRGRNVSRGSYSQETEYE